jgi:hypothetical protein
MKQMMVSAVVFLAACGGAQGVVEIEGVALTQTLPDGLSISRARISLAELEIEGGTEEDDRDADLKSVELEIALAGAGSPIRVESVEAGTYHTLGLEISGILVEGTVRGETFSFTSSIAQELTLALDPEVDVGEAGSAAVAVSFDIASWFQNEDGSILDPNNAGDQKVIEARILSSMTATQK